MRCGRHVKEWERQRWRRKRRAAGRHGAEGEKARLGERRWGVTTCLSRKVAMPGKRRVSVGVVGRSGAPSK
eukprot:2323341-Pleurochrysis_carterae.AAC.1